MVGFSELQVELWSGTLNWIQLQWTSVWCWPKNSSWGLWRNFKLAAWLLSESYSKSQEIEGGWLMCSGCHFDPSRGDGSSSMWLYSTPGFEWVVEHEIGQGHHLSQSWAVVAEHREPKAKLWDWACIKTKFTDLVMSPVTVWAQGPLIWGRFMRSCLPSGECHVL